MTEYQNSAEGVRSRAAVAVRTAAPWRWTMAWQVILTHVPGAAAQSRRRRYATSAFHIAAMTPVVLALFISCWQRVQPPNSLHLLAGSGGMPGNRKAGNGSDAGDIGGNGDAVVADRNGE